jgi:hypothetical protein
MLTSNQLESACRVYCSVLGQDPDEVGQFDVDPLVNIPRWQSYKLIVGAHERLVQAIIVGYTTAP